MFMKTVAASVFVLGLFQGAALAQSPSTAQSPFDLAFDLAIDSDGAVITDASDRPESAGQDQAKAERPGIHP